MITITQLFIKFLKDNNSYDKFVNNFENHQKVLSLDRYFNSFNINSSTNFINVAFSWETTNEGYKFWEHLNKKWKITLFKILLPYLVQILKKHNMYGYWIVNAYKEENILKKQLIPYDYLYKILEDSKKIDTFEYNNARAEWIKIIVVKTLR